MKKYDINLIKQTVRNLRQHSTPSEILLWKALRNRQLNEAKFLRQYPILFEFDGVKRFFVADFYCHELMLVMELVGKIHERQKDYDTLRAFIINHLGYSVIRFKNEEVLFNLSSVLSKITEFLT